MYSFGFCILFFLVPGILTEAHYATVFWDNIKKVIEIKDGVLDKNGDAYGFFNDTLQSTGWGVLEIVAGFGSKPQGNKEKMYLAGFLEGFLTAPQMFDHHANIYPHIIRSNKTLEGVKDFIKKQDQWTREQVKIFKKSPLWRHVGYVISQLDGLFAGAAEWAKRHQKPPLTYFDIQFLNAVGDLLDVIQELFPPRGGTVFNSREQQKKSLWEMGHCSALIKVLPGYENIFMAHSSWFTYASTLRIYKHWNFNISDPFTATSKISFSSYPGFLVSLDDFYILGSGLVMLQTTNQVFNSKLFKEVEPQSLFAWQRVRVANMMANNGQAWGRIFEKYNSGTYNNQYMILDLKKVELKKQIRTGALYIVEQIPTLVRYSDQTAILQKGYWPSYNIPFDEVIYNMSSYPEMVKYYGNKYSYELCPRAKIFRRDQGNVKDMESMKHIMRYNNYLKDIYAEKDPCNTICCREDLKSFSPIPGGCYDSKVTDYFLASQFTAFAINGPTTEGNLPVFNWDQFKEVTHKGLPNSYNFSFVTMKPLLFQP
ncbi:phospholipase B-like 1 isoform X2 [Protopterus annectens]|uniref:phospholipase B-like 1 isoform X2 n=1 Tax=Protopterus annectens TaxID=7888 RepID=UPI001CFC0AF7|nr:phospholipase B-like 1 isoform X2 [Protopterus annectens]